MPLIPGDKLGPYEIVVLLGAGGMGEVYRAHDTRLGRAVALKVSAERFSERFEREARAIAALNHTNVCTLHDVGPNYLVMELVEGQTLAERIKQGAIPLDEALAIAKQIVAALEAAHEKGITHRDLKPGNIILKPDGTVKVLDFGLAKMGGTPTAQSEQSPTLTIGATQAGVILGTAAYMAPEQARGKEVDRRADIWAFGVVLYEMVTGQKLFKGEDLSDTLASVIKEEPKLERVPAKVQRLLRSCLEKDPKQRLQAIGDWRLLMEEPTGPVGDSRWGWAPWAAAGMFLVSTAAFAFLWLRPPAPDVRSTQFLLDPPGDTRFTGAAAATAISPDGRYIVFAAGERGNTHLWLRPLDSLNARPLQGTEGVTVPFWSPDSKSVAYYAGGKLKRSNIAGGAPQILCDAPPGNRGSGGAWSRDGTILFSQTGGIARVPSSGGVPQLILKDSGADALQFLPDGKRFLYSLRGVDSNKQGIYAGSLDNPEAGVKILATDHKAHYVPAREGKTGFLLWLREQTLLAQPFDAATLRLEGDAIPIAEDVLIGNSGRAAFWTSDAGVLCYRTTESGGKSKLIWMGRDGKRLGEAAKEDRYRSLRLSPDGTRVALAKEDDGGNVDIWALEFGRNVMTRLTFDPARDAGGAWSPDGSQIAYRSNRNGAFQIYRKDAGGGGKEELLTNGPDRLIPGDLSRDGRYLVYTRYAPATNPDIWALPLEGERKPFLVLQTQFTERGAKFSPDGKWIAYESNESGRFQIYVRAFPPTSGQWQVSNQGGSNEFWRGDGKELYYVAPTRDRVMAANITVEAGIIKAETPRELFAVPSQIPSGSANFGVTADGQRFLVREPAGDVGGPPPLTVVTNWQAGLKK